MKQLKQISPNNRNTYITSGTTGNIPVRADDVNPIINKINEDSNRITILEDTVSNPPYKTYTGVINNVTGAPVLTILYNDLGYIPAISGDRSSMQIVFSASASFRADKITVFVGQFNSDVIQNYPGIDIAIDVNSQSKKITLTACYSKGTATVTWLNLPIEIKIFE